MFNNLICDGSPKGVTVCDRSGWPTWTQINRWKKTKKCNNISPFKMMTPQRFIYCKRWGWHLITAMSWTDKWWWVITNRHQFGDPLRIRFIGQQHMTPPLLIFQFFHAPLEIFTILPSTTWASQNHSRFRMLNLWTQVATEIKSALKIILEQLDMLHCVALDWARQDRCWWIPELINPTNKIWCSSLQSKALLF